MRILVTAGPTREYIDTVRFITNASSGRMGHAVAGAAAAAGHDTTLLTSRDHLPAPAGCQVATFGTVDDLKNSLDERFSRCDALVMAAAVGDFKPESPYPAKLHRAGGPITLRLFPTEDIIAGLGERKRPDQIIVAFCVEDGPSAQAEAKARSEMIAKNADFVVVNTPAAMAADESYACILSRSETRLPWATRPKEQLAEQIVALLES